ncbi:MAG: TIGR03936 family radical SAM-associated protein [Candidatus Omnitrophota bacterium]
MPEAKIIYKVTFNKDGWMRYISHLDLMRLFARVLRRAGLKPYLTKGFNPHPLIRIKNALKLGLTGKGQEAELILTERTDADEFKRLLVKELPAGIEITKCEVKI